MNWFMEKSKKKYIINLKTMSLFPSGWEMGQFKTIVIEEDSIFTVNKTPLDIVQDSCVSFASTYEGRKKGTYAYINVRRMPPILISDGQLTIFFPLMSPENNRCIWLSHKHVKHWWKVKKGIKVQFSNLQTVFLPIQLSRFETQVYRSAQFRHVLLESMTQSTEHLKQDMVYEAKTYDKSIALENVMQLKENGMYFIDSSYFSG